MIFSKFKKLIGYFVCFKNPLTVIAFKRGFYPKGQKIKVRPYKDQPFFVARSGDNWLLDKVLKGEKIQVSDNNFIIQDGIYLRQGTSDTFIYKEIFIDECYKECTDKLTRGGVVIDIGAHIGLFSLYCSPKCNKIYAYEPHRENYDLAVKNLKQKGVANVNLYNLAIWSKSGEIIYLSDKGTQTGAHTVITGNQNIKDKKLKVNTTTIEDIFIKNNIDLCDLLKMDIEGAEYVALLSTPDFILKKIKTICMEFHPDLENKHTVDDLVNFLKKNQFIIVEIKKFNESIGLLYAKHRD